jgi:hypothetical protein
MEDLTESNGEPGQEVVSSEPEHERVKERISHRIQNMQIGDLVQSNPELRDQLSQFVQIVNRNEPSRKPLELAGVLSMNVKKMYMRENRVAEDLWNYGRLRGERDESREREVQKLDAPKGEREPEGPSQ